MATSALVLSTEQFLKLDDLRGVEVTVRSGYGQFKDLILVVYVGGVAKLHPIVKESVLGQLRQRHCRKNCKVLVFKNPVAGSINWVEI